MPGTPTCSWKWLEGRRPFLTWSAAQLSGNCSSSCCGSRLGPSTSLLGTSHTRSTSSNQGSSGVQHVSSRHKHSMVRPTRYNAKYLLPGQADSSSQGAVLGCSRMAVQTAG